jgi:hypothetical protein
VEDGGIFPLPHNSLPLQVQNAVPAHDRGFLLNDSRVAQFQGPLGQSAWASNGYFLAAQDPVVTFSQSRPEKEGPRRRSISICDSRPVAESYILPLYNHSRRLKIRRRPVSAIGGFEPFGFDLCGVASFVADTANGPWEFVGNSLVQIENHYFRHGAWLKSATSLMRTALAIRCFANAVPRAIGDTKNA